MFYGDYFLPNSNFLKILDVIWFQIRQYQRIPSKKKQYTGHPTIFNDGQNPYQKSSCKSPKTNEVKLFIKDENQPNL